jgi:nicotinate-nucleotide adenylyltransferase
MRKIGIFGGTFDPVHYGHLRPALEILDALSLDHMLFIPAGQPPHRGTPAASAELRLAMLEAALREEPRFRLDGRELKRPAPSYTVDTLTELRREHPSDALVLVVGMDAFLGFPTWHRWRELFGLAHVVVAHRPGWTANMQGELAEVLRERRAIGPLDLSPATTGKLLLQPVTQLEISATQVRDCAARGADIRYLVPEPVRRLILDSHCYA